MSAQQKEMLKATIFNLSDCNIELFAALASLSDEELEQILNDLLKK